MVVLTRPPRLLKGMNRRLQAGTLFVLASVLITATAAATPRLAVAVGFDGRFVPEYLAPLRVEIVGAGNSFAGFLLVTQKVGNPWRGEAESRTKIPLRLSGAAEQEHVIAIYDFIEPLRVELLSEEQEILAEQAVELRAYRKEGPFPVTVGALSPHFDETFVAIDPSSLPVHWAAYEAVSSLWIGSITEGISSDQWEAIGQWVLAGGTLVLFSGADFYLLDSPSLRELLPLADPSLGDTSGLARLHGEMRPGADRVLSRDDLPLVVARRYGAGAVFLSTVRPADLVGDEFSAIVAAVAPANLLSLASEVEELLEATSLQRPGFAAASLLVLVSLCGFTVIVQRMKRTKQRIVALVAVSAVLCVLSGLYINQANILAGIYRINTSLHIQGYFGNGIDYVGLFKTSVSPAPIDVQGSTALIQELPRSLQEHDLSIEVGGRGASLTLERGERRTLRAFSSSVLSVTVSALEDGKVRVGNGLDGPLKAAVVIVGETAFPIGEVPVGEESFALRNAVPLKDVVLGQEYCTALFRTLCADFFWGEGVWLVGARERRSVQCTGNTRTKVRDLVLVVVAGEDRE